MIRALAEIVASHLSRHQDEDVGLCAARRAVTERTLAERDRTSAERAEVLSLPILDITVSPVVQIVSR